jgi:hypothetical protein
VWLSKLVREIDDRVVILPRDVAAKVMSGALARGTLAVALVSLVSAIPIVCDVFINHGVGHKLVLPVLFLLAMIVLVAVCGLKPSPFARSLYLLIGGALALGYTVSVLTADPSLNDDAQYLGNRVSYILVLIVVMGSGPIAGVAWILGGFAVATAVNVVASLILGYSVDPGLAAVFSLGVAASCFIAVHFENRNRARMVPDLARLAQETRSMELESQFELRAAAIVHDTVLGDLAAVMHSDDTVDERMRARLRADIATLADTSWLSDSSSFEPTVPVDSELRIALGALAMEYQWRGLTVSTSGNYSSVVGISPGAASTLVAVIGACLENIVQHAKCDSADLVFDSTDRHLTAMVVDSGVGFDPDRVASDRLGLRASIVGRIEAHGGTVKVWSSPGSGTSIVITIPSEVSETREGPDHG